MSSGSEVSGAEIDGAEVGPRAAEGLTARLQRWIEEGVSRVTPAHALARAIEPTRVGLRIGGATVSFPPTRAWALLSLGKAADAMAHAIRAAVSHPPERAMIVTKCAGPPPSDALGSSAVRVCGDHPVPGDRSVAAGTALLDLARTLPPEALGVVAISGGTSALACAPLGLSPSQYADLTRAMMMRGATITQLNTVRRCVDALKAGGLRSAMPCRQVVTLAISDVPDDDLPTIGSGPTIGGPRPRPGDAAAVLTTLGLQVWAQRVQGLPALRSHAPVADDVAGVIARADDALDAIEAAVVRDATREGARVIVRRLATRMTGPPDRCAQALLADLTAEPEVSPDPPGRSVRWVVVLAAGECTPTHSASGRGGRACALAGEIAARIEGEARTAALVFASDGEDGASGTAGAFVDGSTAQRAARAGQPLAPALARCDSALPLEAAGGALPARDTGTNVGDLVVIVRVLEASSPRDR